MGQAVVELYGSTSDAKLGVFQVPSAVDKKPLRIIATSGMGWDHVSISRGDRCPDWTEMEQIKRLFFKDHEVAMQLHVTAKDHVNVHPTCLHLWRPTDKAIPLPPKEFVG